MTIFSKPNREKRDRKEKSQIFHAYTSQIWILHPNVSKENQNMINIFFHLFRLIKKKLH